MNNIILEVCTLERSPFGNAMEENIVSSFNLVGSMEIYQNSQTKEDKKVSQFVANRMDSIVS